MTYNFSSFPRVGSCIPTRTSYITDPPRFHHNFDSHYHNHFNPHCHDHFYPYYDELELNVQLPEVKIPSCPDVKVPPCPDVKCPEVKIPSCPDVKVPPCPDVKCPEVKIPSCPDVKVPPCPDVKCPEVKIPSCPDVKCPDIPSCPDVKCPDIPSCPDVKCPDIPPCPDVKCPECPVCPEPKKPIDFSGVTIAVDGISGEIKDLINKKSSGLLFQKCIDIINKSDNHLELGPDDRIRGQCDSNPECKACVGAINAAVIDTHTNFSEEMSAPEYMANII